MGRPKVRRPAQASGCRYGFLRLAFVLLLMPYALVRYGIDCKRGRP